MEETQIRALVPRGEKIWCQYWSGGKCHYVITSKVARDFYYLYNVGGDKLIKVAKAKTPPELEAKMRKEFRYE